MQLRELKKTELKQAIIQESIKLFICNGFDSTLVEHIVEPLKISKRTFFRYFKSKEDVVFAWYEELTEELVATLKSRPQDEDPFQSVCESVLCLLKYYDKDPQWALSMMQLSMQTPSLIGKSFEKRTLWEQELTKALLQRCPSMTRLHAKILVGSIINTFVQATNEWFLSEGKIRLRSVLHNAFKILRDM